MQHLKLFSAILLSSFLLYSCSGNTNANAVKDESSTATASATSSGASAATGDASFSCTLDGKSFSGKGSNGNINMAFHSKDQHKKGKISFMLADLNDISQKLDFEIPGKAGTTTIQNLSPQDSYVGLILTGFTEYIDDPVTVNVTSITASRVTGTFSGKYTVEKGSDSNAKQTIEVTDGKFDIPFTKENN